MNAPVRDGLDRMCAGAQQQQAVLAPDDFGRDHRLDPDERGDILVRGRAKHVRGRADLADAAADQHRDAIAESCGFIVVVRDQHRRRVRLRERRRRGPL